MAMRKTDDQGGVRKKIEDYSYVLTHNIGKGYSSQVFRGRNDTTEQTVAVKVIDMRMIKGEVHKNLLASEIEVLKSLKGSPGIIDMFDIYNTRNNTYIITELCEGGDLSKMISARKSLPESEAVPLMNQILEGYVYMQSRGIIHRDLKPANVFMKAGEPKIADFGFAMRQCDCKKYSSYNVGSPIYMPPEALNENKYSFKSDIWALGVIYFEMLTGKTPWRAKNEKDLGRQLVSIPIKKLLPHGISASSQAFLIKTLTVSINDRMSPQELRGFSLGLESKVSVGRNLCGSENSIFDGRNNHIRMNDARPTDHRRENSTNKRRHQTSINKMSLTAAGSVFGSGKEENPKGNSFLPKTASSINQNRTEQIIGSNKTINTSEALTQKEINVDKARDTDKKEANYDKKALSKQILSQIHFCRFLYKLLVRMGDKLDCELNSHWQRTKEAMVGLIFGKLEEVQQLKGVGSCGDDYKKTADFNKINQIIEQYRTKYTTDLAKLGQRVLPLQSIKQELSMGILSLYEQVSEGEVSGWKEEVIVLDYLVTLRQLISLLQNNDLEGFHNKSKIEAIVEGSPSKTITSQHLNAICNKLKAIKIL